MDWRTRCRLARSPTTPARPPERPDRNVDRAVWQATGLGESAVAAVVAFALFGVALLVVGVGLAAVEFCSGLGGAL